jgi:hypothetical protein
MQPLSAVAAIAAAMNFPERITELACNPARRPESMQSQSFENDIGISRKESNAFVLKLQPEMYGKFPGERDRVYRQALRRQR